MLNPPFHIRWSHPIQVQLWRVIYIVEECIRIKQRDLRARISPCYQQLKWCLKAQYLVGGGGQLVHLLYDARVVRFFVGIEARVVHTPKRIIGVPRL